MTVTQAIESRRSIRKYSPDPVDPELIKKILNAAILAPSAKNRQPWKFIVYTGSKKDSFVKAMSQGVQREQAGNTKIPGFADGVASAECTARVMNDAPVLIAILNTEDKSPFIPLNAEQHITEISNTLSIGAAIENMILSATESGLGTLWIANTCYAYEELEKEIGTESQLAGVLAVGHSLKNPDKRPRKSFEEVVEFRN